MQPISLLLLASGTSSRMNPLSDKIFFEYLGKPILEWQVENSIAQKNIENIYIVGNEYNIENIKILIETKFSKHQNRIFIIQQEILSDGMKGGILSVENFFPSYHSLCVISSNDIVENWFLEHFLHDETFPQSDIKICGKIVEKYFPGGYLSVNQNNEITHIIEKPGEGNEPSNMINLVIHWFKNPKELFELLKNQENNSDDAYEKSLQILFEKGKKAYAVEYNGIWQSLKYPWHHLDMMKFFLLQLKTSYISESATVSSFASIHGVVYIEEGVKILDFSCLQGPLYIGKNTLIGNHSLIRESIIGENCCIGQGTEIARSYVRKKVYTHRTYIGDSVIDDEVNFGAGCSIGNLRHDHNEILTIVKGGHVNSGKNKLGIFCGKNCRFGVNTSFAPGIFIGENTWVFPHLFLQNNIEKNSFIKPKKEFLEYERKENVNKV